MDGLSQLRKYIGKPGQEHPAIRDGHVQIQEDHIRQFIGMIAGFQKSKRQVSGPEDLQLAEGLRSFDQELGQPKLDGIIID